MKDTKIEWCDHSWSPWRGCTKVSPGCAHCYAETLSKRNPAVLGQWGNGKPRVLAKNWNEPARWNRSVLGDLDIVPGQPDRFTPYHRPTVFPSLCDWLDDEVPVEWLARFLQLIHATPNLTWLLLTKRPENWESRMAKVMFYHTAHFHALSDEGCQVIGSDPNFGEFHREVTAKSIEEIQQFVKKHAAFTEWLCGWLSDIYSDDPPTPPANVWVGTSVEDQNRANERIPALLSIPAAGRFLSVEPLLGPVTLPLAGNTTGFPKHIRRDGSGVGMPQRIHWVIIGGESGNGARPCNVEWIRSLVRQCKDASVPCFVKQLGAAAVEHQCGEDGNPLGNLRLALNHTKGGDPEEWPEDLRVREFPEGLR